MLFEDFPGVVVGNLGPFADFFRRDRDKGYLAVFGRTELGLVIVEVVRQRFRRRRVDGSGLRGAEFDVFDGALFVLEAAQRFDQRFRRFEAGRDRAGDLTPQRYLALFGDISLFGETELPDRGLETCRVEIAGNALEVRIGVDRPHDLGVRCPETHPPRFFVQGSFGDGLLQDLAIEAEGPGLIHRQRAAELAAELLQLVGVELPELFGRNFGLADRGQRRLSESLEDVGDAPHREAEDQHPHDDHHDGLAEPV